jgi:hypothetical protein
MQGWQTTAPSDAVKAFERYKFVNGHAGWTYRDYDEAAASDILLDKDFTAMLQPVGKG